MSDPKYKALHKYMEKLKRLKPKRVIMPRPRYASRGVKKPTKKPIKLIDKRKITQNAIQRFHLERETPDPLPAP